MKRILYLLPVVVITISCNNQKITNNNSNKPIILGDSSTIVTEHDAKYLQDFDFGDAVPMAAPSLQSEVVTPATDTVIEATNTVSVADGQNIAFGSVKMMFVGLNLKEIRKQNPEKEDGLTYTLLSGQMNKNKLSISGVKQVRVRQRYQTRLSLSSDLGLVDLRDLGMYTSEWSNLPYKNGVIEMTGLDKVDFTQVNNAKIKSALDKELRKRKTNSKVLQSWMNEVKSVRNANDKPCDVILDNVQWQISGTDIKGVNFHKNIRLELK